MARESWRLERIRMPVGSSESGAACSPRSPLGPAPENGPTERPATDRCAAKRRASKVSDLDFRAVRDNVARSQRHKWIPSQRASRLRPARPLPAASAGLRRLSEVAARPRPAASRVRERTEESSHRRTSRSSGPPRSRRDRRQARPTSRSRPTAALPGCAVGSRPPPRSVAARSHPRARTIPYRRSSGSARLICASPPRRRH